MSMLIMWTIETSAKIKVQEGLLESFEVNFK